MYAIGHIRPHSLCAGPSLSLTRQSPRCLRGPLTSWPSFAAYLPLAGVLYGVPFAPRLGLNRHIQFFDCLDTAENTPI